MKERSRGRVWGGGWTGVGVFVEIELVDTHETFAKGSVCRFSVWREVVLAGEIR